MLALLRAMQLEVDLPCAIVVLVCLLLVDGSFRTPTVAGRKIKDALFPLTALKSSSLLKSQSRDEYITTKIKQRDYIRTNP